MKLEETKSIYIYISMQLYINIAIYIYLSLAGCARHAV